MTLEQLRIFVAVAERGHVTQAAGALNMTQSAVSAAIAALETRHGVRLFDRVGRSIEINAAGKLFLEEARAVLAGASAAERALEDLAELRRGSLSIHASQTIANYWLPARLHAYRTHHPGISLRVSINNTEQVARAVIEGLADLGLVEGATDLGPLEKRPFTGDALAIVVAAGHPWAGHPWAGRGSVTPSDLKDTPWVLREPGSGTRAEFEDAIAGHGLTLADLTVALELPSNEAICAAVEAGAGAAAISHLVSDAAVSAGRLRRIGFAFPARPFHALWHRERRLTRATEAFLQQVVASEQVSGLD
jgi:DNA-binding transcriptional LysR family regulator